MAGTSKDVLQASGGRAWGATFTFHVPMEPVIKTISVEPEEGDFSAGEAVCRGSAGGLEIVREFAQAQRREPIKDGHHLQARDKGFHHRDAQIFPGEIHI